MSTGASKVMEEPFSDKLRKAGYKALGGGLSGAAAMVIQVLTLMPLRTTMNTQYRYGGTLRSSFDSLYKAGGFMRFYSGLGPALVQGPLARFGDTFAVAGSIAIMDSLSSTADLPVAVKTIGASILAGTFRILLVPVDTVKTIMQVEGKAGLPILMNKVKTRGPTTLFHGALGSAFSTALGHYPFFAVNGELNSRLKKVDGTLNKALRHAFIGFVSSIVSDSLTNSLRVLKTYRQTASVPISYMDCAKAIIEKDGYIGLLGRGLKTRLLANGLQGLMFTVLWRTFEEQWNNRNNKNTNTTG